jgi:hypothetical protein
MTYKYNDYYELYKGVKIAISGATIQDMKAALGENYDPVAEAKKTIDDKLAKGEHDMTFTTDILKG